MTKRVFRLRAVLFDIKLLQDADEAGALLKRLSESSLKLGLVSKKKAASLREVLEPVLETTADRFETLICPGANRTRVDAVSVRNGVQQMGADISQVLVVASNGAVLKAGREAGAVTLCVGPGRPEKDALPADYTLPDLSGVFDTVRLGLPLSSGKFPNELLERHFTAFPFDDPSLIVQPAVGEDTAAVDIAGDEVLVLKSDPITFAADAIGQYAVLVNANDIATAGAVPRWMLTTLLFPSGTTPSEVLQVMDELQRVSRQRGITLCGGHTEISDAVTRPLVVGVMAGTVNRAGLVDKGNLRPGDQIYLTKAVSVEGTSIIARELGPRIENLGVSADEIRHCRSFLKNLSILEEAALAARCKGVSAMHDVTEGGLSTALLELAWAGGRRIRVDMDCIPVFDETRRLCHLLDINPLGLIGSGSLLICCRPADGERLTAGIQAANIRITRIGEVVEGKSGVSAEKEGKSVPWPRFEVDEIARIF